MAFYDIAFHYRLDSDYCARVPKYPPDIFAAIIDTMSY